MGSAHINTLRSASYSLNYVMFYKLFSYIPYDLQTIHLTTPYSTSYPLNATYHMTYNLST